jgi:WD40 repeat protein
VNGAVDRDPGRPRREDVASTLTAQREEVAMGQNFLVGVWGRLLIVGTAAHLFFACVHAASGTNPAEPGNRTDRAWPGWRGPSQDGHSSDPRVPLEWGPTKNLQWQIDLPGFGNSSPIAWENRVFLTSASADGSQRFVLCIDRNSGKILWQRTAATGLHPEPVHPWNTHASATCVTDGQCVYAFFGTPGLFCYDLDGNLLWHKDFGKLSASTGWGAGAASPILFEDLVILNGDQGALRGQVDEKGRNLGPSWLWAMNKRTGDVVWKTPRNQGMGWGTPIIWTNDGRQEVVLNGQLGVWSYEPRTGKELWHVMGRQPEEGFGEGTPVWGHGMLFVFTGKPGPAWAIHPGGSGDVSNSHVAWRIARKERDVSSPILVGDHLYTISRIGVATCLEAKTGRELWRERLGGQPCASLLSIRGKVMFLNEEGAAFIVEPGPEFKLLHENKLGDGDEFRASPAVVDGQLLIRSNRRLYALGGAENPRLLKGHTGSVMSVAFSPDDKKLATSSRDQLTRIWDTRTGKIERTLEGHGADIYAVTFSPDGKLLATGSGDKTVRLWDPRTGQVIRTLAGHTGIVRSVDVSPDQKTLVSAGVDLTIRLWDVRTGKLKQTLTGHTARVMTVVYSRDGKTFASASSDKTARLWDADTGQLKAVLAGHTGGLEAVAFSPDGKLLASSSQDGTVRLWELPTTKVRHILKGHVGEIDSVAFSPDGKTVASGCKDTTIKLWNAETGALIRTLTGSATRIESLAFSHDGKTLASGSGGPEALVRLWHLVPSR